MEHKTKRFNKGRIYPIRFVEVRGKKVQLPSGYLDLDTSYPIGDTMYKGSELVAAKKKLRDMRGGLLGSQVPSPVKKKNGRGGKKNIVSAIQSSAPPADGGKTDQMKGVNVRRRKYAATGPDARNINVTQRADMNDWLGGQVGKVKIVYELLDITLQGVCNSMISYALSNNYRQNLNTSQVDYPWLAANFAYNILLSVASGNTGQIPKVKVPVWLLDVIASIAPKSNASFMSGTLEYAWTVSNPNKTISPNGFYPNFQGSNKFYYASDTTSLGYKGYPTMALTSILYTDSAGALAFTDMCNFFERASGNTWKGEYNPWKKVDLVLENSSMKNSVSAFAFPSQVWGVGQAGGFTSSLISSQTFIQQPKFARFANPSQKVDAGYRSHRASSGDTNSLVGEILLQMSRREYNNKNFMIFKYIDFMELADRLLRAICEALTNQYKTTNFALFVPFLDGMEFLLMLRAVLMSAFRHNYIGQTLWPYVTLSVKDFSPFLSNCATVNGTSYTGFTAPLFFNENVKALLPRAVYPNDKKSGRLNKKSLRWYMPVLGMYQDAEFNFKDYTYFDSSGTENAFFLGSGDNINLCDGTNTTTNDILDIANANAVNNTINKWNTFMTVISPCVQYGSTLTWDHGINVLQVITMTNLVEQQIEKMITTPEKKNNNEKGLIGGKRDSVDRVTIKVTDKSLTQITTQQPLLSSAWNVQKSWVLPEIPIYKPPSSSVGFIDSNVIRIAYAEPWEINFNTLGNGATPPSFSELSRSYIANCVKSATADNTEIVEFLKKQADEGHGGILGMLANVFADVAPPLIKVAGNVIDGFVPF